MMKTRVIAIDPARVDAPEARAALAEAGRVIAAGGLVAFPTETVYGLGANALDAAAAARIFEAKRRALNDPLIVHVRAAELAGGGPNAALEGLRASGVIGDLPGPMAARAGALIQAFWPGPLTLVVPRGARIPLTVTSGGDTVGIRMPGHPIALGLLAASGVPIAAPSANLFGHVSPTAADHVLADLDGRIDLVLDGGPTAIGVESTVLDLTEDPPRILRPGGAPREAITAIAGRQATGDAEAAGPLHAPGLLDKHYAPRAPLRVLPDLNALRSAYAAARANGHRAGLLLAEADRGAFSEAELVFSLGDDAADMARRLYAGLRALDDAGADCILVLAVRGPGLAEAIADRLKRAARR